MILKDEESKFSIEASYEYIGLKLMYIIKLFMKGDKFPSGKLSKTQSQWFLAQSIEFLIREEESSELLRLNSRTFFKVVSELFSNSFIASKLTELNKSLDEAGAAFIPTSHLDIISTLYDRVLAMQNEPHLLFEYSLFIIQICLSDCLKLDAQKVDHLSTTLHSCLKNIMAAYWDNDKKEKKDPIGRNQKYSGPGNVEQKQVEDDILKILPYYAHEMDDGELEELIYYTNELKFDRMKIQLYEQKQEFDRCVDIYLNSKRISK
jgi:hypothetical protein